MKLMLVVTFCALIATCLARPQSDVQILEEEVDNSGLGNYKFSYTLSDGTKRTEEGVINNPGTENESLTVRGSVSWVAPDGQTYTINFVADENGFQPEGAHLPK